MSSTTRSKKDATIAGALACRILGILGGAAIHLAAAPPEVDTALAFASPSNLVPIAYITHPSRRLHDMGPYHPECPERLDALRDRLIASGLDDVVLHYSAPQATRGQLARAHSSNHIENVGEASPD